MSLNEIRVRSKHKMAIITIFLAMGVAQAATALGEAAIRNITRFSGGDLFTIPGNDCGPTRCMEESGGTALAAMGTSSGCLCQCAGDTPGFREDQRSCVSNIEECQMASFGRGATKPHIPFVFLPLKGQIIYPSKEIIFTDMEDAICVVKSAQYLSNSGWVTLRDVVDNDVPFGLYRDEGKTFLQWLGSVSLHARLEGRLVVVHVLCSSHGPVPQTAVCAAFRVAGASHHTAFDVRSIPFHAGETITLEPSTQSQGLSVLESLAIGVCVLMLIFVYAAGIVFYIHYKQRQKRKKNKDLEMNRNNNNSDDGSGMGSMIDMDNIRMKSNPLLNLNGMSNDYLHDAVLSDVSEHTEETLDSSPTNTQKKNICTTSAMIHTRRKKPSRPSLRSQSSPEKTPERFQRRSASPDTFERAPHSDLSIIDCSVENNSQMHHSGPFNAEPAIRRKLYFNPVFFETEHLKNPPPAAIDFLIKIREVMSIAKEKMTSKRFIPNLSDIPEEELYHTIDLGWDIPCARRGRRFSAISLKRENSRRAVHCGGCPGCNNNNIREPKVALVRSNSCKSCVSDDYKQKIVRKWLDEVPTPPGTHKPVKSVAKVSGTPRVTEPKEQQDPQTSPESVRHSRTTSPILVPEIKITEPERKQEPKKVVPLKDKSKHCEIKPIIKVETETLTTTSSQISEATQIQCVPKNSCHSTRRVRKKLPPPPPPPTEPPPEPPKPEEPEVIPPEIKKKMEAVIKELNRCRRVEPKALEEFKTETVAPIAPKLVIPVIAADSNYYSDDSMLTEKRRLQREPFLGFNSSQQIKQRRFSVADAPEIKKGSALKRTPTMIPSNEKLTRSWRDLAHSSETTYATSSDSEYHHHSFSSNGIFINSMEPIYDNVCKPGPLTIQIRGSPIENRKNNDSFDPDTLDRKPRREEKMRVEKISLRSASSFKYKPVVPVEPEIQINNLSDTEFTRKIGSLREIYEAKAKAHAHEKSMMYKHYDRRGSDAYESDDLAVFLKSLKTPDLLRQAEIKPPVPIKQRRVPDLAFKFNENKTSPPGDRKRSPEEREKYNNYLRGENLNARRSGRRSNRTRSRRTDLRKLYRTEDSGYLSTDSNDSKRRAQYLIQLRPRNVLPEIAQLPSITARAPALVESDTDDFESLCDGRSESGGESIETDSVFFGHFEESKRMLADLDLGIYGHQTKLMPHDQIDSGFIGETNIILSGDSDSEHRSVISIVAGCDGRASAASFTNLDEAPYLHTVEC